MRNIIICIIVVAALFYIVRIQSNRSSNMPQTANNSVPTTIPQISQKNESPPDKIAYSVFFPYWSKLSDVKTILPAVSSLLPYDSPKRIYFGVTITNNGIDTNDSGYTNLQKFLANSSTMNRSLVLRVTNDLTSQTFIKDPSLQNTIATEITSLAKQNGFNEIILDLEVRALPTDETVRTITNVVQTMSQYAKKNKLQFSITLYGDVFYRKRPYDVIAIAPLVDSIYVMAYDFHKANGEPGPNFPLAGYNTYGYDLHHMTDEYLQFVPSNKLQVIFGMYGYDWALDDREHPLKAAKAIPLQTIKNTLLQPCNFKNCRTNRDSESGESFVQYIDDAGYNHRVWFEDEQSVHKKIDYLLTKGINHFSFWAYGYY